MQNGFSGKVLISVFTDATNLEEIASQLILGNRQIVDLTEGFLILLLRDLRTNEEAFNFQREIDEMAFL